MATVSVESLAQAVSDALGPRLVSLILYGSAARGSGAHVSGRSDINTLLICDAVDDDLFVRLGAPVRGWTRAGNPAPLILTEREWRESADVFAIEYEEMREAHRVLAGRDPWSGVRVVRADVRRQLEQELMGKLVRLRQAYLALHGDRKALSRAIVASTASFFTMLRATLRLAGTAPPQGAEALVREAARVIGWPAEPLSALVAHASARATLTLRAGDPLPGAYLAAVARTAEFVNTLA